MYMINGIKVVCSDMLTKLPAIQIRPSVVMSNGFRDEMNAWLLEMFGYKFNSYMITDEVTGGQVLVMHSHMLERLKLVIDENDSSFNSTLRT